MSAHSVSSGDIYSEKQESCEVLAGASGRVVGFRAVVEVEHLVVHG